MTVAQSDNVSAPKLAAPKLEMPFTDSPKELATNDEPTVRKQTKSEDKPVGKPDLGAILNQFVKNKDVDDE